MARPQPVPESSSLNQPLWTLVLRVSWLAAGPAALILFAMNMIMEPHSGLAIRDALYAVIAILVIALRWIDFYFGEARFPMETRSTVSQVRRHSIVVAVAAIAAWGALRAWGAYFAP